MTLRLAKIVIIEDDQESDVDYDKESDKQSDQKYDQGVIKGVFPPEDISSFMVIA